MSNDKPIPQDAPQQPEQNEQPVPAPVKMRIKATKEFGITEFEANVVQSHLNVRDHNEFNLRVYMQNLAESRLAIDPKLPVQFNVDTVAKKLTVHFLEPDTASEIETA